jgi:PAS domain S-box-containing protein
MAAAKKYNQLKNHIDKIYNENNLPPPNIEEDENFERVVVQSLQNLSQELKKYRMLFEHAADPVFVHDMHGIIIESNNTASAKYGYTSAEFKNMPVWQVDVSGMSDEVQKKIDELNQKGKVSFETMHKTKSGNTFHVEVHACIISLDKQNAVVSFCRDISERKLAEQEKHKNQTRLKYIIQQLQDGIVVFKKNGKILIWNSGIEQITGVKAKDALHRRFYEIQYDIMFGQYKDKDFIRQKFDEIVNMSNPLIFAKPIENQILHPEKGVRIIQATVYPIRIRHGKYIFGSVLRDITRNKNIENKLRDLNITKDKIFSIIAHDLKTPFNSIIGFSDILLEKYDAYDRDQVKKLIQYINLSAKPTLAVLENLLEWVNAQTGRLGFMPKYFFLNHLLKEVIELLLPSAKIKNINLQWKQSEDIEVFADYNMMSSVLRNLITNAVKFTNPLGQVTVSYVFEDEIVKIMIRDTGVGMDEKKMKTIFHLDKTKTTTGTAGEKGSGLGLILSKEFIEKHGGRIEVESIVGEGTQFTLILPVKNTEKITKKVISNNGE